ncbi:MAG: hypothetical protein ACE5I1_01810 [bacterium]
MGSVVLSLLMISIFFSAMHRVRKDPRFTRTVIYKHIFAIALYFVFCTAGVLIAMQLGQTQAMSEARTAFLTAAMLLWIVLGCVILAKYTNGLLRKEQSRLDRCHRQNGRPNSI